MTNWLATVDISKEYQKAQDEEISSVELAKVLLERLNKIPYPIRRKPTKTSYFLAAILDSFQDLIDDENDNVDDFDEVMNDLYDWADEAKVWIKTFDIA